MSQRPLAYPSQPLPSIERRGSRRSERHRGPSGTSGSGSTSLGYAPIRAAQAIKDGFGRSIAVIVGDLEDQGAATIIAGVLHAAEQQGMSVAVRATLDSEDRERVILQELRGERHRAVDCGHR